MQDPVINPIQAIQAILAPAIGISAVGLLLLGLSNRYSSIVNRIRLLNDERRKLSHQLTDKGDLSYTDRVRLMSIQKQTPELYNRSRLVRNAILSFQSAIALFVLTSVAIALNLFVDEASFSSVALIIFVLGMISVLVGVIFAAIEIHRSYRIVLLEVKAEE